MNGTPGKASLPQLQRRGGGFNGPGGVGNSGRDPSNGSGSYTGGSSRFAVYAKWVCLGLAACAAMVGLLPSIIKMTSSPRGALSDACLASSHLANHEPLSRATAAVNLERHLDGVVDLGACFQGKSMLAGVVSNAACAELLCLYSAACESNYDLWFDVLTPLPASAYQARCPLPSGGQVRQPGGGSSSLRSGGSSGGSSGSSSGRVEVSFILSVHNNIRLASQCLMELYRTASEAQSAEFIVIDDGSTDDTSLLRDTVARLAAYFDAVVVYRRHEQPKGYGATNMAGARLARGEYLALINSDMFVGKGWLATILATFARWPKAGLVGPLFLGEKMLITEAGGIIWADASAGNYGRGDYVSHNVTFARPVDYISAAGVVVRRAAFFEIGGFDPLFGRGYYEDTDMAMSLNAHGYQVIHQPLAVVYHQEGTTLGTDASQGKQLLMTTNRRIFFKKWSLELRARHCPKHVPASIAYRGRLGPKIFWVDDIVPEPDHDSGSIRTMGILKILLEAGYDVTYQPSAPRAIEYVLQTQFMGVDVLPAWTPDQWLQSTQGACPYDAVVVARRYVYENWRHQLMKACQNVPFIYDTVDIHFLRESRDHLTKHKGADFNFASLQIGNIAKFLDALPPDSPLRHNRDVELDIIRKAAVTVVVSADEVKLLTHYVPQAKIYVISNIHEPELSFPACSGRSGVLFVGNFNHPPNQQAVKYLLTDILPFVLKKLPPGLRNSFVVNIVGANIVPWELQQLFDSLAKHVVFHGWLSNEHLRLLHHKVKIVVAPLLSGAGVKGKVNQAMKYGVPVVATPVAVEGMHLHNGTECLVGDGAEDFATRLVSLYTDCTLWQTLVAGGFGNIRQYFSPDVAKVQILKALAQVGAAANTISQRHFCE